MQKRGEEQDWKALVQFPICHILFFIPSYSCFDFSSTDKTLWCLVIRIAYFGVSWRVDFVSWTWHGRRRFQKSKSTSWILTCQKRGNATGAEQTLVILLFVLGLPKSHDILRGKPPMSLPPVSPRVFVTSVISVEKGAILAAVHVRLNWWKLQTGILCVARAMQCCSMPFTLCRVVPAASRCAVLLCCAVPGPPCLHYALRCCTNCITLGWVCHATMLRWAVKLCCVFPVVLRCANFTETDKSIKPLKAAYLIRGADPLSKTLNNFLVTLTVKSKIASLCSTDLSTESGKLGRERIQ